MNYRKYFLEIGKEMDENFLPDNRTEILTKLMKVMRLDIPDYFDRNISPDMAAEFIAFKLGLTRHKKGN